MGKQRIKKKGNLESLENIFYGYYKSENSSSNQRIGELLYLKKLWYANVGERIAFISSPFRLNGQVLQVIVHDPAWISELPYLKEDIIKKLNTVGFNIKDIKFTLSKIRTKKEKKIEELRELTEKEKTWAIEVSDVFTDMKLKETYYNTLLAYLRNR